MPVPHTLTRLSQSLGLISSHQLSDSVLPELTGDAMQAATDIANYVLSSNMIGGAYQFTIRQSKNNNRRYGINSPIEAFSIVPGTITTDITIKTVVLYVRDAMQAFNFSSGNIAMQNRPLIIQELVRGPDINITDLTSGYVKKIIDCIKLVRGAKLSDLPIINIYLNCWISESNIEYKLEGDQIVIQDLTLNVARIVNPNILEAVAATGIQRLARHIPLVRPIISTVTETLT